MIYEEVIAYRIRIATRNLHYFFQVPLPRDTKRIIGIETSCQFYNPAHPPPDKSSELYLASYPNDDFADPSVTPPIPFFWKYPDTGVFGDLKLSSSAADVFYSETIKPSEVNETLFQDTLVNVWMNNLLMNFAKREENVMDVHPGMGLVEGCFVDTGNAYFPPYDLKIFIRVDVDHRMDI